MGTAISQDPRISIKKSLFSTRLVYVPTRSSVKIFKTECSAEMGRQLQKLLTCPDAELAEAVRSIGRFEKTPLGNYQLQGCLSADHQFAVLQLYQYSALSYVPVSELRIYEGAAAQAVGALF